MAMSVKTKMNCIEIMKCSARQILPGMLKTAEKIEGEAVYTAVNTMLEQFLMYNIVYKATHMVTSFRIFPFMMRGFSPEEIMGELEKRGYKTFNCLEKNSFIFVKIPEEIIPDDV